MENINNMVEWKTAENGSFPFELHEKGLNLKGLQKYFFYFSFIVSVFSMLWGMLISVNILHVHLTHPGKIPNSYVTIAIICICVCMFCLSTFYNLYKSKKIYRKDIIINDYNGYLLDKNIDFADKINNILCDKEKSKKLSNNSKNVFYERNDINKYLNSIMKIYDSWWKNE